jgi:hypothetical protein
LVPAQQAVERIRAVHKDVASIVKDSKAKVLLEKGQRWWRHPKLQIIQEQAAPTQGKAGNWVARACLV